MNSVHISGLVKGEAQTIKEGNILRILTIVDSKQNSKEFKVYSPAGETADKFAKIPSGKRVILEGRFSGEEFEEGSGVYHGVVSLVRLIAITEASSGQDYAKGYISGLATAKPMSQTATGTPVVNLNIKNTRTFHSKKQNKEVTLPTYVNAVAWTEKAKSIEPHLPLNEVFVEASGMLVPSEYDSQKNPGVKVAKIEIWLDEISIPGSTAPVQAPAAAPRPARAPAKPKTKGTDDDLGF